MAEDVARKIALWMSGNGVGNSSKAIASATLGAVSTRDDYPRDGDDLGRCLRLIEMVPECRAGVDMLAAVSGPWKRLAAEWDTLAEMHRQGDRGLHAKMRALIDPNGRRSWRWGQGADGLWDLLEPGDRPSGLHWGPGISVTWRE